MALYRGAALPINDPLFQIAPHSVSRLKTLSIVARPEILPHIITHLPPSAPLLEMLDISHTYRSWTRHNLPFMATFFNGDLSSLRKLRLEGVRTDLPWRNMVNLTLVVLRNTPPDGPSIKQLLDFFESAPRLRKIKLDSATPATGEQRGRLVSLAYLKRMGILWDSPSSLLLNHLLVPIGAKLSTRAGSSFYPIEGHPPGSLDNLRNISNITTIQLRIRDFPCIKLSGPSGQLTMVSGIDAYLGLDSLARLDTSKVERLEIVSGDHPLTCLSYRGLLPLESLRTLTFSRCREPYSFMAALGSNTTSSGVVTCPKLEEIILIPCTGTEVDIKSVTKIAAARFSGGVKLRTVRIGGGDKLNPGDVLELKKHVLNVECLPVIDEVKVDSDSDDSDEDFW